MPTARPDLRLIRARTWSAAGLAALRESIADDIKAIVAADPAIATRLEATGQVVDIRGPTEFTAGIKEMRDHLASIAQTLGFKAAE
jgi:hypothetical protein